MLNIIDGKVLLIVQYNYIPTSISILALAKKYSMKFIAREDNQISYRAPIQAAHDIIKKINNEDDKHAYFDKLIKYI